MRKRRGAQAAHRRESPRPPSRGGCGSPEPAGVRTPSGPGPLPVLRRADVILDAGGDPKLVGPIQRNKLLRPKLLDGPAMHLALRLLTQYRQGQAQLRQAERMAATGN